MKLRSAIAAAMAVLLVGVSPILAARLWLDAGSITIFDVDAELPIADAVIDIEPENLERKSEGPPVTVFIEAPGDAFGVGATVVGSVRLCQNQPLCETGPAVTGNPKVDDADGDDIPDLKVTFDRGEVLALAEDIEAPADVEFVVSGLIEDGTAFSGTAQVRLVDPEPVAEPTPTPGATPRPRRPRPPRPRRRQSDP